MVIVSAVSSLQDTINSSVISSAVIDNNNVGLPILAPFNYDNVLPLNRLHPIFNQLLKSISSNLLRIFNLCFIFSLNIPDILAIVPSQKYRVP